MGALLVVGAGLLTFTTYLDAEDRPTTTVLVASGDITAGTRISDADEAERLFDARALHLDETLVPRTVAGAAMDQVVGRVVTAPLGAGDPVLLSALSDAAAEGVTLAFSLPRVDALDGTVRAGDRIDLLGTRGGDQGTETSYLLTDVEVRRVTSGETGIGSSGELSITVVVPAPADALLLAHAARTSDLLVVRSMGEFHRGSPAPASTTGADR